MTMINTKPVAEMPTVEQQRALVQQILASNTFRKSHRLASFLRFICEETERGRAETIHEQHIGVEVFGRAPGYHIGEDSIVRSQARFLRLRLHEYFAGEGKDEPLVLTIPKGSYIPEYQFRDPEAPAAAEAPVAAPSALETAVAVGPEAELPRRRTGLLRLVLILAVVIVVSALGLWRWRASERLAATPVQRFWASLFDPHRTTILVPADSSLVLMDEVSGTEIQLSDYMTRRYRNLTPPPGMEHVWSVLVTSQYTNVADLRMVSALERIPGVDHSKTQIRFARDVSLSELKQNNVVLIGSARANPWVDLFQNAGHFRVGFDVKLQTNLVENRNPGPGEQPQYIENGDVHQHLAYGVAAYLPSLDQQSSSLLIGGTSKAGTEAAAEFLLSPEFDAFLKKLNVGNGPPPHFEVLLAAQTLNGTSYQRNILSFHLLP